MDLSDRISKISSVVAAICIAVYAGAISFGIVQIVVSIGERRNLAQIEFYDLTDRASSSAVFLGFMSEPYKETIRDFLNGSDTIMGIIITGSGNEFAFERQQGNSIAWVGDSPRFKTRMGFPDEPFFLPLRIEGQWNVSVQATYSYIDYSLLVMVLRNTLIAVLGALALALLFLLLELSQKKSKSLAYSAADEGTHEMPSLDEITAKPHAAQRSNTPRRPAALRESAAPQGLFSPRSNVGWEAYTHDRLISELHRCASFEQDLVLLCMDFLRSDEIDEDLYRQFTDEAVSFFTMRDLIFEKGNCGITVIIPSMNLEQGISKSEEFRGRIMTKLPESFEGRTSLCVGLSSRSGRLIEANRLVMEASKALEKAMEDQVSPIIAFKSDPEKFREFIKNRT